MNSYWKKNQLIQLRYQIQNCFAEQNPYTHGEKEEEKTMEKTAPTTTMFGRSDEK